jgi:voltage-gated potassium channel
LLGAAGFVVFEDVSYWRGFEWSLDTVATVGSIPAPESTGGQVVKVLLIVLGVGTLFSALVFVTEFYVAGHLSGLLESRRRQRKIDDLKDHFLICGFGRVGRQVATDLKAAGASFLVIDDNPESADVATEWGVPYLHGRASDDDMLKRAGIERASGVIACVDSDAENIFITLTAKELRPEIEVVARASQEESESKLRRAGADRVVSPYKTSGAMIAKLALQPQVRDYMEVATGEAAPEFRIEEMELVGGCRAVGETISDLDVREHTKAVILALRRRGQEFEVAPAGDTVLGEGDVIIGIGSPADMDQLEAVLAPGDGPGRVLRRGAEVTRG